MSIPDLDPGAALGSSRDVQDHVQDEPRRAAARSRAALDGPVPDGPVADDPIASDLEVIATSMRVLANRIAELDAEVHRQSAVAERLRGLLAAQTARRLEAETAAAQTAGAAVTRALACEGELALLRETRLFRWSRRPRHWYSRVRALAPGVRTS